MATKHMHKLITNLINWAVISYPSDFKKKETNVRQYFEKQEFLFVNEEVVLHS